MRLGEQLHLCWERVDLSRGVVILTKTKTGNDREVPMNPEVFELLSTLRKESTDEVLVHKPPHGRTGTGNKERIQNVSEDRGNRSSGLARSACYLRDATR